MPDAPGKLWVVATPIGNLEDFSPRGRATLEQAHTVLCEDTRQGAKLISALGVSKSMSRLERLDAHVTDGKLQAWSRRMLQGESFALITDAGTPAISDPGSRLVAIAREEGVEVIPVPGPSAVPTLLSVAGFEETAFTFRGFFPRKDADQRQELLAASRSELSRVYVWFESPQRIEGSLRTIAEVDPSVLIFAAKELTKLHEKSFRGAALEVSEAVSGEINREGPRGEWVFAVRFSPIEVEKVSGREVSEDSIKALHCLIDAGVAASEAARQVSHHFGAHKKTIYDAALKISGKKSEQGD